MATLIEQLEKGVLRMFVPLRFEKQVLEDWVDGGSDDFLKSSSVNEDRMEVHSKCVDLLDPI